jgi:hypothetical protein
MRFSHAFLPAVLMLALWAAAPPPASAAVSIAISVGFAPPPLPVYEQPVIPGSGYIWMPGYWAYGPYGYYWVPGTWVLPPAVGLLWTPPWWGWNGAAYIFHAGYWGPRVGYYGGINYGFGYFGSGYEGGRWDRGRFFYNREVNNFGDRRIINVYNNPVERREQNRVSFAGGVGGIGGEPNERERAVAGDRHWHPTGLQTQHFDTARTNPSLRSATNNGQPPIVATDRAGRFNNAGRVGGKPRNPRGEKPKQ